MQKAFSWLDAHQFTYKFHNFKTEGISSAQLKYWLKQIPLEVLLNKRSTTFRELSDTEKDEVSTPKGAVELMVRYPTLIKRPVLEASGRVLVGFDAIHREKLLPGN